MTVLQRYIIKTILQANGLVILVISGVLFCLTLLLELKEVGHGNYGLLSVLFYVAMRIPNLLYQFLPILALLGSLLGLGILHVYHELLIMRTLGYTVRHLGYCVLSAAGIFIFMMTGISEAFVPSLNHFAHLYKENCLMSDRPMERIAQGIWLHEGNRFIYIDQVVNENQLIGVTQYQLDTNQRLKATYVAQNASHKKHQWMMHHVLKTTFGPTRLYSVMFSQLPWDLHFNRTLLNTALIEPEKMNLKKIINYAHYLTQNQLPANLYQYEFWKRILQPFLSCLMIGLILPVVLNTMQMQSFAWRFFLSMLIGCLVYLGHALLNELCVVYQLPGVLAASFPVISLAIINLIILFYMGSG